MTYKLLCLVLNLLLLSIRLQSMQNPPMLTHQREWSLYSLKAAVIKWVIQLVKEILTKGQCMRSAYLISISENMK